MFQLVKNTHIPIGWLHQHAYCEYQFFLEKVRKIKMPPSHWMLAGGKSHNQLYQEFKELPPIEEPLPVHIKKMAEGKVDPFFIRELYVKSDYYGLRGRIDEIQFTPNKVRIIDFKPRDFSVKGDELQLYGYAVSFSDMFGWEKEIECGIQSTVSGDMVFLHPFTEKKKQWYVEHLDRLKNQLDGKEEFTPTPHANHCVSCRFKHVCSYAD